MYMSLFFGSSQTGNVFTVKSYLLFGYEPIMYLDKPGAWAINFNFHVILWWCESRRPLSCLEIFLRLVISDLIVFTFIRFPVFVLCVAAFPKAVCIEPTIFAYELRWVTRYLHLFDLLPNESAKLIFKFIW